MNEEAKSQKQEPFFCELLTDDFQPTVLFFAIMVVLSKNRWYRQHFPWRIDKLSELIRQMRYHLRSAPWVKEIERKYQRPVSPSIVTRLLISFWAPVLGVSIKELCLILNNKQNTTWRRAFSVEGTCYPQRISELHQRMGGSQEILKIRQRLQELVCQLLLIESIREEDVEFVAANCTFETLPEGLGEAYGFNYFLSYVFWQGLMARFAEVLSEELKPNGYSLRDLLTSYLARLDNSVKNSDDLAAKLRLHLWSGEMKGAPAPCAQTLINFIKKLQEKKLIELYEGEILREHRGKKRITVAVDATLLELFGNYEEATSLWDHHKGHKIRGYKLHVIFSVTTALPIAFHLHQEGDKDADVLDKLVKEARRILSVKRLGIILFDKGYWRVEEFEKLVTKDHESLITPAKQYSTVKKAIADIPKSGWVRVEENLRCAETEVRFGEEGKKFRLVAWKKLGWRKAKDSQGKVILDENGEVVKEPFVLIHSYLTNLSEVELEADQILGFYSQRWGIEDFFEEIQNQYHLAKFPSSSFGLVKRHIVLTFLLYSHLQCFQKMAAQWMENQSLARMELRRFCKEFLHVPVARLHYLRAGKPKEKTRRSTRRGSSFLKAFFF